MHFRDCLSLERLGGVEQPVVLACSVFVTAVFSMRFLHQPAVPCALNAVPLRSQGRG